MMYRLQQRIRASVRKAVRGAMRELILREVDRVLMTLMEPGIDSYDVKGPTGEVFTLSPDAMQAFVVAVRTRFQVEL